MDTIPERFTDQRSVVERLRVNLPELRQRSDKSQAWVARKLNVTQSAVSAFERGIIRTMRPETMELLDELIGELKSRAGDDPIVVPFEGHTVSDFGGAHKASGSTESALRENLLEWLDPAGNDTAVRTMVKHMGKVDLLRYTMFMDQLK